MNNSALKLFHELMKKGWIDRNDNSLMWNLVEDNEASLIDIKKQVNELDEENQRLKKQLDIREKMTYDEGAQSFILPDPVHGIMVISDKYRHL